MQNEEIECALAKIEEYRQMLRVAQSRIRTLDGTIENLTTVELLAEAQRCEERAERARCIIANREAAVPPASACLICADDRGSLFSPSIKWNCACVDATICNECIGRVDRCPFCR